MRFIEIFGNEVILHEERWQHIVREHSEVEVCKDKIVDILRYPDLVKRSRKDRNVWLSYKFYQEVLNGKYLLAVIRTEPSFFIITFYVTDKIKKGEDVWTKN